MTPRFFIDRPIFSWVIAIGILLAGIIALRSLPVEQYPSVAPPSLTIGVTYPGADAGTLEQNVTQVIEQELNGVEGFLYMASTSESNGTASITLTFEAGTNIVIEDELMRDALLATGLKTKREVVELGLRTLLRLKQQQRIKTLRGKIGWKGDLGKMRTDA